MYKARPILISGISPLRHRSRPVVYGSPRSAQAFLSFAMTTLDVTFVVFGTNDSVWRERCVCLSL